MIAQARAVIRTSDTSEQWFLVEGDTQEEVIEQLRMRAVVSVGTALVYSVRASQNPKLSKAHMFTDGAFTLGVEVKWGDNEEPHRHDFVVRLDELVGDMMEYLLNGKGGQQ